MENAELQRQMGCMSRILQMLDRRRLLTSGRKKVAASGNALTNCNSEEVEKTDASSLRIVLEKSSSKSLHENNRTSVDLSRTSFSSSSCSSFSSLDCNRSMQEEHPSIGPMVYTEKSTKDSPRLKNHVADTKTACSEPQADLSKELTKTAFLDSIYKDAQPLSVGTSAKEEMKNHVLEHKNSPRHIQQSKSADGLHVTGIDGRSRMQVDLAESLRVLVKLKEAPRYFSELNGPPRKPSLKESPRFSYDGRGSRLSLDPQEPGNVASKFRELPRLSLDSREGSLKSSKFGFKTETASKIPESGSVKGRTDMTLLRPEEQESCKWLPSVVVKLMGLEAMPNLCQEQTVVLEDTTMNKKFNSFNPRKSVNGTTRRSTAANQDWKGDHLSYSPKRSTKDHPTPRRKNPGSVVKPISHSRVPIEPAPWRHRDKSLIPQKMKLGSRESYMKQQSESVCSEIEKKLREFESEQSNKDRALKHILDSMHAKGFLKTKKDEDQPSETLIRSTLPRSSQKSGSFDDPDTSVSRPMLMKGDQSPKAFESPIIIMKPAKYVNRSDIPPCSAVPLDGLSDLRRLKLDKKKDAISMKLLKEQTPEAGNNRVPSCRPPSPSEKKCRKEENGMHKNLARMSQVSPRAQVAPRVDDSSTVQASNSVSPRLQQKKVETERISCSSHPSSQLSKPPKQPANRHSSESMSPRSRLRQKPTEAQLNCDQQSEAGSRMRRSPKRQVDGCVSLVSQEEPKKSHISKEEISVMDLTVAANEQPSPVSALDASPYQDDSPSSRITSNTFKDDETPLKLSSGLQRRKFANLDHLIDRLRQLHTNNNEAPAADDHITLLCEDHQYVLEILLASGLLMRNQKSNQTTRMPIQLHPSGHPINPDLFLVLEQTKSSCLAKPEKLHRKLVFDVVNELLLQKMELASPCPHPNLSLQVRKGTIPIGQCLLKELCSDIKHLKAENLDAGDCSGDHNVMPGKDMLQQSRGWIDSCKALQPIGLEIERLIFKDLINEIVS